MKKYTLIKLAVIFAMITMVGTAFAWDGNGLSSRGMGAESYSQSCTMGANTTHHDMNHGWSDSGRHGSNDDLNGR